MSDANQNGNESPTEHERRDKGDTCCPAVSDIAGEIEMPHNSGDDSFLPYAKSGLPKDISGLSRGALSVDNVPPADASPTGVPDRSAESPTVSQQSASPRSHDDTPVGTVFGFESHITDNPARKSSRESSKSQTKSGSSNQETTPPTQKTTEKNMRKPSESSADFSLVEELQKQLDTTIAELLASALQCEGFLESERDKMPRDAIDEVEAIVGGTRLLCQDKLGRQFRNLCLKAKGEMELKSNEVARPTNEDLEGFWALVMLQVDEVRNNMKKLHQDKENLWQTKPASPVTQKKKVKRIPKSTPSSKKPLSEAQKKRDAERKARIAELRAQKLAQQRSVEPGDNPPGGD